MEPINCIVVDDEPLALSLMENYVKKTAFLNLKGAYTDANDALSAIDNDIKILFLDIEMSGINGMEIARQVRAVLPELKIIFTTAYNQFAVEGYKVAALDYLLKPFGYDEFLKAATRAYQEIRKMGAEEHANSPAETEPSGQFFFVKADYKYVRIAYDDVAYVESVKDYLKIHFVDEKSRPLMTLGSMKSMGEKLPADRFMRIHRSYIVALNQVISISKNMVTLKGNTELPLGDQYKESIKTLVGKWMFL